MQLRFQLAFFPALLTCGAMAREVLLAVTMATGVQEPAPSADEPAKRIEPTAVCARVDDFVVTYADIERERKRQVQVRKIGAAEQRILESRICDQLVQRHLALAALQRLGKAASTTDIDFELSKRKQSLAAQGTTLEAHLAERHLAEKDLRREILWALSWTRYLDEYVTEANLEKFFKEHQADYDGRRVKAAQILLKAPSPATPEAIEKLIIEARKLRETIETGQLSFADAAKQHSQSPSAANGGELGWITRREPMGEEFSKMVFALKPGETSESFVSPFGVHLAHCLEIEPGKKTWRDVRKELERDTAAYLGRWLADSQRDHSHVERTDVLPVITDTVLTPGETTKK